MRLPTVLCPSVLLFSIAACGGDGTGPTEPDPDLARTPASVTVHAGADQAAAPGAAVAVPPAVLVRNSTGAPVQGVAVQFTVASGGGQVTGASPTTDASGVARVDSWVLGASGEQRLTAQVADLPQVTFEAAIEAQATVAVGVAAGGGKVEIDEEGHPYDGLTLEIPAGAFPQGSEWSLRVDEDAPTISLPAGFTTAGPTLEIRTSAGRTETLMTLDIPVPEASGKAIVIAVRDPVRGVIEVLPTVGVSPTSIRVMAGHLRGDLLLGPADEGGSPARSLTGQGISAARGPMHNTGGLGDAFSGIAQLIPIEMLLPMLPASSEVNPWPILDHGSAANPDGFGPAIAALEVAGAARRLGAFAAAVRPLDVPGFYAEPGPLAALSEVSRAMAQSVANSARQISDALSDLPKPQQDEIVHHNVVANIRLSGLPTMVAAFRPAQGSSAVIGAAIEGSSDDLLISMPTAPSPVRMARVSVGFASISVPNVVGAMPQDLNSLIPLSSLIAPFERIGTLAERIARIGIHPAGSEERRQLNEQLAGEAGLPLPIVEIRADEEADWKPVVGGSAVARSAKAILRVVGGVASLHGADGARIAEGTEIPLEQDGELFADEEGGSVLRSLSTAIEGVGGVARQVAALSIRLSAAIFGLEKSEIRLEPGQRQVEFRARVPLAPESGYRIEWDWGDGTKTETTNSVDASYEYEAEGDYTVTATLLDMEGDRLSRTTGSVRAASARAWRITSLVDQDDLLGDEDIEGSGPTVDLLYRLLASPAAGLIAIEPVPGAGTELRLRVHRSTTWSGLGDAPPAYSAQDEHLLQLGTDPPTPHDVGPFFAGWEADSWTQTTDDPGSGSMTGRYALGHVTYEIEDLGTQRGPAGGVRFEADRDGATMTGTLFVVIWWQDEETGEVYEAGEEFRFAFEAHRWGAEAP